jgi:hypothetical protein
MGKLLLRHHNNCPRCPLIGAEDISADEYYTILSLRFSIRFAQEMTRRNDLIRVEPHVLQQWLVHARIDESHLAHIPCIVGHGIMVTLPAGCGMPLIDGNHRAARSLRQGTDFFAAVLDESETLTLLRKSMGRVIADRYWKKLGASKPHPLDYWS